VTNYSGKSEQVGTFTGDSGVLGKTPFLIRPRARSHFSQEHRAINIVRVGGQGGGIGGDKAMDMSLATDTDIPELQVFDSERLRKLMHAQGLTTTDLGARAQRSSFTVRLYCEGRADPPANVMAAIAFALGVRIEDLFRPATSGDVEMVTVVTPRRVRRTKN
jgi:hypothetical protein